MVRISAHRWEHGSEYYSGWEISPGDDDSNFHALESPPATFFAAGRQALLAILAWGASVHGWRRLWVPMYYCHDVTRQVAEYSSFEIQAYRSSPLRATQFHEVPATGGDAVVINNLFGMQAADLSQQLQNAGVSVIEDHSHDPFSTWAQQSTAAACFASLRKTLPISDGGSAWFPSAASSLPRPNPDLTSYIGALSKQAGMLLKRLYLSGRHVPKPLFRGLLVSGEARLVSAMCSSMTPWSRTLVPRLRIREWRRIRHRNFLAFKAEFNRITIPSVLESNGPGCPFAIIVVFPEHHLRDRVRAHLISNRIYPAILWPMEKKDPLVDADTVDVSQRILALHCDMRYSIKDMSKVATILKQAL